MAYRLYVKGSSTLVGELTSAQLQTLVDRLEEEHAGDRDYWIDADVLELLEDEGADAELLAMLRLHVGEEGVEVEWRDE